MIDFSVKPEKLGEVTVEDAREHEEFINELNYLVEEGFIQVEESQDGQLHVFATT